VAAEPESQEPEITSGEGDRFPPIPGPNSSGERRKASLSSNKPTAPKAGFTEPSEIGICKNPTGCTRTSAHARLRLLTDARLPVDTVGESNFSNIRIWSWPTARCTSEPTITWSFTDFSSLTVLVVELALRYFSNNRHCFRFFWRVPLLAGRVEPNRLTYLSAHQLPTDHSPGGRARSGTKHRKLAEILRVPAFQAILPLPRHRCRHLPASGQVSAEFRG
jgi:hypothetical protein